MIGILTFYWADDYGAMLQAYALKRYLEEMGEKAEILPYAPLHLAGRYYIVPIIAVLRGKQRKYCIGKWMICRNLSVGRAYFKRWKNMGKFRAEYLTKKTPIQHAGKLSLKEYSCVFVGSDQVWNPEITVGFDDAYLGRIRDKGNCRIVAYGASLGSKGLKEQDCAEFAEAVQENFADISMREKSGADFVGRILHRKVVDVLDPTLLLTKEEWEKIGRKPGAKDYILFYSTEENRQMIQYARKLAKTFRKKVFQVSMPLLRKQEPEMELAVEGGPAEFVGYVKNAWCVVTNSFHGTVFSILMEKQFLVFSHSSRNERMESLLKKLDMEERLIMKGEEAGIRRMFGEIHWEKTKEYLEKERTVSKKFIMTNME